MPSIGTPRPEALQPPLSISPEFRQCVWHAANQVAEAFQPRYGATGDPVDPDVIASKSWRIVHRWKAEVEQERTAPTASALFDEFKALRAVATGHEIPAGVEFSFACADALLGYYPAPISRLSMWDETTIVPIGYGWRDPRSEPSLHGTGDLDVALRRLETAKHLIKREGLHDFHAAGAIFFGLPHGSRLRSMPDLRSCVSAMVENGGRDDFLRFLDVTIEQVSACLGTKQGEGGPGLASRRVQPPPGWNLQRGLVGILWPDWRIRPAGAVGHSLAGASDAIVDAFVHELGAVGRRLYDESPSRPSDRIYRELLMLCQHEHVAALVDQLLLEHDLDKDAANLLGPIGYWRAEIALRLADCVYSVANAKLSRWPARQTLPSLQMNSEMRRDPTLLIAHVREILHAWDPSRGTDKLASEADVPVVPSD